MLLEVLHLKGGAVNITARLWLRLCFNLLHLVELLELVSNVKLTIL